MKDRIFSAGKSVIETTLLVRTRFICISGAGIYIKMI